MKTLSDICPCGKCDVLVYTYDRDYGIIWHFCAECHWWYVGNQLKTKDLGSAGAAGRVVSPYFTTLYDHCIRIQKNIQEMTLTVPILMVE